MWFGSSKLKTRRGERLLAGKWMEKPHIVMAPIPMKSIVSVSSEDKLNPASNLLSAVPGGKWLCAPENRCRMAEVVIELSKRARITSIEIANFGSAFVEVFVSNSESPDQHITILHMSMLMTPNESRTGRNKNKIAFYCEDKLSASAILKKWNRVKIICVQKYNQEAQFGLRSVSFFGNSHDHNAIPAIDTPSPSHFITSSTPLSVSRKRIHPWHKYPSSEHKEDLETTIIRTPKRPLKNKKQTNPSLEDFEFSGVENQSRLFHDCLRGKPKEPKGNQILERITADREKYQKSNETLESCVYRKKLLKRDLHKAEAKDFMESYKERKGNTEMTTACHIMSSHDNDYEIGEEPDKSWGWNKFTSKPKGKWHRRNRPTHDSGVIPDWLSKKRKLDNMVGRCSDILERVGHGELNSDNSLVSNASSDVSKEAMMEKVDGKETDSDSDTITYDYPEHDSDPITMSSHLVECPLCLSFFPSYAIQLHASVCGDNAINTSNVVIIND